MATRSRRYAGSGMGGFGSGFAQGFGLVSDFYKSQEEAALRREELDMDRAYREGLIADKAEQRKNEREAAERQDALLKTRADTAAVQADTASIQANTAKIKAQNEAKKYDSEGNLKPTAVDAATLKLRGIQQQAQQAQLDLNNREIAKVQKQELDARNAATISDLMRLSQDGSDASAAEAERIIEENEARINNLEKDRQSASDQFDKNLEIHYHKVNKLMLE